MLCGVGLGGGAAILAGETAAVCLGFSAVMGCGGCGFVALGIGGAFLGFICITGAGRLGGCLELMLYGGAESSSSNELSEKESSRSTAVTF